MCAAFLRCCLNYFGAVCKILFHTAVFVRFRISSDGDVSLKSLTPGNSIFQVFYVEFSFLKVDMLHI